MWDTKMFLSHSCRIYQTYRICVKKIQSKISILNLLKNPLLMKGENGGDVINDRTFNIWRMKLFTIILLSFIKLFASLRRQNITNDDSPSSFIHQNVFFARELFRADVNFYACLRSSSQNESRSRPFLISVLICALDNCRSRRLGHTRHLGIVGFSLEESSRRQW